MFIQPWRSHLNVLTHLKVIIPLLYFLYTCAQRNFVKNRNHFQTGGNFNTYEMIVPRLKSACPTGGNIDSQKMLPSAIIQKLRTEETLYVPPQRCGNCCASASACWCSQGGKRSQTGLPNGVTGRTSAELYLTLSLVRAGLCGDTFFTVCLTLTHHLNLLSVTIQPKF